MTQNNNLPRIKGSQPTGKTFLGVLQVLLGSFFVLSSLGGVISNIVMTSLNLSLGGGFLATFWIFLALGSFMICNGYDYITVNSTFRRMNNFIYQPALTIDNLSELLGESPTKLLQHLSIISQRRYWRALRVLDDRIEITPFNSFATNAQICNIYASKGMRFRTKPKHTSFPHITVAIILSAVAIVLPLPFKNFLWILVAIVASFPLKKVFDLIMPKIQYIEYEAVPAEAPREIKLELSGDEMADELILATKENIKKLDELNLILKDDKLKKEADELSQGLEQMMKVLKENPAKHRQVRQTLDYSIPTAIKLYYKYVELDAQPVKGENIVQSMNKIHDMSGLVLKTFQKELDGMYQDQSLDIEVDIEVMRNMLQQESLDFSPITSDDFK